MKFAKCQADILRFPHRSGPTEALILERDDAIAKWRNLLGPTKVFRSVYSHPESIRGLYGLTDTRNACHGSDSVDSVVQEIEKVFPEFSIESHHRQQDEG